MIGAIIGDIAGSRFEWTNHRSKDFDFFAPDCSFTDDTVMSLAVCDALMKYKNGDCDLEEEVIRSMQRLGRLYPNCGYGGLFRQWLFSDHPQPYQSFGNGSAMRVSGCAYAGESLEEVRELSRIVTKVSHNHPEGLKGAEAIAVATFLARTGKSAEEIREEITTHYYPLELTLDELRRESAFDASCQRTVPQAFAAFFESDSFEDAVRNAISIGGDSDTLAAMTASIAEAFYGVPETIREAALSYLDEKLRKILLSFEERFPL